jgi:AraC-like DNA-binding protein
MTYYAHNFTADPLAIVYKRRSENYQHRETFHYHLGLEVLYIHDGKGTMIVGNNSYPIKPGMLCVFQPCQLHHLTLEYDHGQIFERSYAIFEPTMFEDYFKQWPALYDFYRFMYRGDLPFPCLYDVHDAYLTSVFHNMYERYPLLSGLNRHEEISLFLVSLFRAMKQLWDKQKGSISVYRPRREHHRIERILTWIEDHYTEPFRLEDMSKALHLSPYHVSHLFKEATGISITDYIATRRIHQAVQLLTTTNQPISQVAQAIGLTNTSYFCKLFRNKMGVTPLQYRKRWGLNEAD